MTWLVWRTGARQIVGFSDLSRGAPETDDLLGDCVDKLP